MNRVSEGGGARCESRMSEVASEACLRDYLCHPLCARTCDLFGVYSDITKVNSLPYLQSISCCMRQSL